MRLRVSAVALIVATVCGRPLLADDATTAAAPEPAPAAAASRPAEPQPSATRQESLPPGVLIRVGQTDILTAELQQLLAQLPAGLSDQERDLRLRGYVQARMFHALTAKYLDERAIVCTAQELAEEKAVLAKSALAQGLTVEELMARSGVTDDAVRHAVRIAKLTDARLAPKEVQQFVRTHRDCFDGTTVEVSLILLRCDRLAATEEVRAAIQKLAGLAAAIKAGQVSFEEAARQHSAAPSADRGGYLGELNYELMGPQIGLAALATRPGQLSNIVRTGEGFCLLKVSRRTEGGGVPHQNAQALAALAIRAQIEDEILAQTLGDCPIIIAK